MRSRPKVFVVNEPLRRNEANELERFLPMETAADFGDVVKLTPDGSPGANPESWMTPIREKLELEWEDGDFLVLVGDQALLAYAASVVGEMIAIAEADNPAKAPPTLRFLKWERRQSAYVPLILREPAAT